MHPIKPAGNSSLSSHPQNAQPNHHPKQATLSSMSGPPINIPEVCGTIRHLCEVEKYAYRAVKQDLYSHIQTLKTGLVDNLTLADLEAVLALHRSLFDLKGRKASLVETEIAKDILLPGL